MALTKLDKASVIAIKDCMGAKKKETILVLTDENKKEIGVFFVLKCKKTGTRYLVC